MTKGIFSVIILLLFTNTLLSESIDTILVGLSYGKINGEKSFTDEELKRIQAGEYLQKTDSTGKKVVYRFIKVGEIKGQRTKDNIMNTIITKLPTIRNIYNSGKYGSGNVVVKMVILSNGQLQNAEIISYTLIESEFRLKLLSEIKTWNFGEIENKNDTTKIIYPFNFSR